MPATATAVKTKLSRQQYLDLYYFMRLNREVEDTMTASSARTKSSAASTPASGRRPSPSAAPTPSRKKTGWPDDPQHRRAARQRRSPARHLHPAHGEIHLATKGKDGTSHFGDLENLHIVSPISMLGDLIPCSPALRWLAAISARKSWP